jgi:PAS domain S-box-containing protein
MTRDIRWWQVIALVIVICGVLLTVWTAQQQDHQLREDLLIKARIAAETVDPAQVRILHGSSDDLTSPDYQHLKAQVTRIRATDPSIRFTYLMGQRPEGIFFFADSESPDSADYSPPGQVFTEASAPLITAFSTKGELTEGPVPDRWGTWVTAFVPVTDPQTGDLVAFFGMDVDATYWYYAIAKSCGAIIAATLLILVLVVTFGLTQRRNRQEQRRLAESEEKFSRAFHANPAIMAVSTFEEGRFLDVNSSFLDTLGYSRDEVIGKTSSELGVFSDPAQRDSIIRQLAETGQVRNVDAKVFKKNREVVDGSFSAIPIDVAGNPRLLTVMLDITERKRAEDALRQSENILASTLEALDGLLLVIDRDHRVILSNWKDHAFVPAEARSGHPHCYAVFKHREERCGFCPPVDSFADGKSRIYEDKNPVDGTIKEISVNPIFNDRHEVEFIVEYVHDITERKRAEDALKKINQKLNVLSQLTRSDLANEIFILNGYLALAKNAAEGKDPIIEKIEKSEQAARSINEITKFIQDYQGLGARPPVWQNVQMSLLFGLSHISLGSIRHELETEDLEIFADPLLEKAWQGLFENSIAHGEHVTRIRVRHRVTPDGVVVIFEDNGIGIPDERKEEIFTRGEGVRAGVRGLFFVREILDITNITIRETGERGRGVQFEIMVPKRGYRFRSHEYSEAEEPPDTREKEH